MICLFSVAVMSVYQEMLMVFVLNENPHSKNMKITGFFQEGRLTGAGVDRQQVF